MISDNDENINIDYKQLRSSHVFNELQSKILSEVDINIDGNNKMDIAEERDNETNEDECKDKEILSLYINKSNINTNNANKDEQIESHQSHQSHQSYQSPSLMSPNHVIQSRTILINPNEHKQGKNILCTKFAIIFLYHQCILALNIYLLHIQTYVIMVIIIILRMKINLKHK